jgi:pimeloyl-ACP methyl ester carboxylesterase
MIGVVLGGVAGIIALAVVSALVYRRARQGRVARAVTIDTPAGIAEGRFVTAGGVDQWIQIRGKDRGNPVLLLVSGAGLPMEPYTPILRPWERHFTVVLWDRRDVGRTRGRNGKAGNETWTFSQLADDGIDIVEFLCRHLNQDKVVLVGHSQGSIVGATMARRRPDLCHAYVGAAQLADMPRNEQHSHELALARARAAGNRRAVRGLERVPPPYRDSRNWIAKHRWSMATDPEAVTWRRSALPMLLCWPGYGPADIYRAALGALFLPPRLFADTVACTPQTLGTQFEVPVLLFHGEDDWQTLLPFAEEYLAAVDAPSKEFVRLPGAGHLSLLTRPDLFLSELLTRVRPLTAAPAGDPGGVPPVAAPGRPGSADGSATTT